MRANARRRRASRGHDDRAVSEVLSYILTFSMITMMIGLLYTGGFVSMERLQTGNQMQNAESVFLAMGDSFSELQEGQAPKRAGALDLDVGASVTVINESSVDVVVNGPDYSRTIVTRSLEYRLEDRAVVYETSAVFRSNDDRSALVGEPPDIVCAPEANGSVVSIVTLTAPDGASVAAGTVTVTGIQQSTELLFPTTRSGPASIDNVTINVTSPREEAWNQYLTEAEGWTDPDGDGVFACESAEQVLIRQTTVEVQIDR